MVETTDSTLSGSSTASRSNQDGLATTIAASSPRKACPKSPSPEIVFAKVDTTPKKACPDEHEDAIFTAEYAYQEEDFAMWEPIDPLPPPHDTSDDEARQSIQENGMHSKEPDVAAAAFAGSSVATVDVELRLQESQEETREDDSQPGTSNALSSPAKKRRRNKEEIEQEKLLKEVNRVHREMRTAKNSKCEQYLFCYINMNLRAMDDAIERELNNRFAERDTSDQLVFTGENMPIKVTWKRKCIDAYVEDGKLNRIETMEPEGVYAIVIDAESFLQLTKSHGMLELVQNSTKDSGLRDAQLTVIVFGKHAVRENVLTDVLFDCYERLRCQFRFVNDARDLSYLITQMHRALAKREKKLERAASSLPVINAEKGIREGPGLVRDWWTRMLSHMHRLSEEQKRALVERYPEPFLLMRRVSEMPAGEAMHELANIVAGNGRRVGPVCEYTFFYHINA
ncbi:Protein F56A6.4 [Aphelenchoides avenae]|nr:Protein F56A6.4 [Aphelenchus avenae]